MSVHEPRAVVVVTPAEKAAKTASVGVLLWGVAALILAIAVLLAVLWLMLSSTTATGFDADGVRCYGKALALTCLKTANPG